jgi:hypothetical protein
MFICDSVNGPVEGGPHYALRFWLDEKLILIDGRIREFLAVKQLIGRRRDLRDLRRNFDLDNHPPSNGPITLAVLTNQAAIQVLNPS